MTTVAERLHLTDDLGLAPLGFVLLLVTGVSVFIAVVGTAIIATQRAVGRTSCRNWSTQTGYPSKFVLLNFFDSGTCLARTPSGRWVLNDKVLTFTERKP